jgi:hypothetical protein
MERLNLHLSNAVRVGSVVQYDFRLHLDPFASRNWSDFEVKGLKDISMVTTTRWTALHSTVTTMCSRRMILPSTSEGVEDVE